MTTTTLEHTNVIMQETSAIEPERTHEPPCAQKSPTIGRDLYSRARKAAARYLELKGYDILDHDWKCDGDSIDIVCLDVDGTLVFVDVSSSSECLPRGGCIRGRRARLEAMAISYLLEYVFDDDITVRFDSVGIVPVGAKWAFLRHHVNAPRMM